MWSRIVLILAVGFVLWAISAFFTPQEIEADPSAIVLSKPKLPEPPIHKVPTVPNRNLNEGTEAISKRNLLDDLLSHLPDDTTDSSIFYAGSELMEVEGLYIDEDAKTGSVFVIGFTKLSWVDGRSIRAGGDDATMVFDPETGNIEIEADSTVYDSNGRDETP